MACRDAEGSSGGAGIRPCLASVAAALLRPRRLAQRQDLHDLFDEAPQNQVVDEALRCENIPELLRQRLVDLPQTALGQVHPLHGLELLSDPAAVRRLLGPCLRAARPLRAGWRAVLLVHCPGLGLLPRGVLVGPERAALWLLGVEHGQLLLFSPQRDRSLPYYLPALLLPLQVRRQVLDLQWGDEVRPLQEDTGRSTPPLKHLACCAHFVGR
mmetsp:Transcript_50039/g.117856  ORF Transcript_50039/g.117856 Transcript_50039/m.117856 type:complete len:213 (+) Transcript_50039:921-1559(+)